MVQIFDRNIDITSAPDPKFFEKIPKGFREKFWIGAVRRSRELSSDEANSDARHRR